MSEEHPVLEREGRHLDEAAEARESGTLRVLLAAFVLFVANGIAFFMAGRWVHFHTASAFSNHVLARFVLLIPLSVFGVWASGTSWDALLSKPRLRDVTWGLSGALALVGVFVVAWLAGGLVVSPGFGEAPALGEWWTAANYVFAALSEELVFRVALGGLLLRVLPWNVAIGCQALAFGLVHVGNPHVGFWALVNTVLAGIALGMVYAPRNTSGRHVLAAWLWHAGWNWSMDRMLGISVSGNRAGSGALLESVPVDAWWSGGDYGLEGGIACTLVLVAYITLVSGKRTQRLGSA